MHLQLLFLSRSQTFYKEEQTTDGAGWRRHNRFHTVPLKTALLHKAKSPGWIVYWASLGGPLTHPLKNKLHSLIPTGITCLCFLVSSSHHVLSHTVCYADSIGIFAVNSKRKKTWTFPQAARISPQLPFKTNMFLMVASIRSHSPLLVSPTVPHPTPSKELCFVVWFLRHRNWKCCLLLTHHHESSITDIYLANTSLGFTQHLETTYLPCYILQSMTPLLFPIYYLFFPCHHVKKSLFSGLA